MFLSKFFTKNVTKKIVRFQYNFVPEHNPVKQTDVDKLSNFIKNHNKILVLTGIDVT